MDNKVSSWAEDECRISKEEYLERFDKRINESPKQLIK